MNVLASLGEPRPRLLVCLDLQRANQPPDTCTCARHVRPRLANCRRILLHARAWDWSVVHLHRRWPDDPDGALPIEGLEPRPEEPVMTRQGLSAFRSRAFCDLVEGAVQAELVLIGHSLAGSGLATVFSAHDRRLSSRLVEDAVWARPAGAVAASAVEAAVWPLVEPYAGVIDTETLIGDREPLKLVREAG